MKDSRMVAAIGATIFAGAFLPALAAVLVSVVFFSLAWYIAQNEPQEENQNGTSPESKTGN